MLATAMYFADSVAGVVLGAGEERKLEWCGAEVSVFCFAKEGKHSHGSDVISCCYFYWTSEK